MTGGKTHLKAVDLFSHPEAVPTGALSPRARRILRGALDAFAAALRTEHVLIALPEEKGWRAEFASGAFEDGELPDDLWLRALASASQPIELPVTAGDGDVDSPGALIGGGVTLPDGRAVAIAAFVPAGDRLNASSRGALAFAFDAATCALERAPDREPIRGVDSLERFSRQIKQCWWVYDAKSRGAVSISPNFETVWGRAPSDLGPGFAGFIDWVWPEDRQRVEAELHLAHGTGVSLEFRALTGDEGEVRWIWLRSFALHAPATLDVSGQIAFVADDVTERKQADESERRQVVERAGESRLAAASELAGGVAHEINNPLTVVIGKAEEIRRALESDPKNFDVSKAVEDLRKIESTAERISKIVGALKQLARKDVALEARRVSIGELVSDIAQIASERFRASGAALKLPDIPARLQANVHPTLLGQALLNLVNNGLEAVDGLPERWVQLDWAEDDSSIFIYVTDSGPGVPVRIRGRIFDAFFTTKGPAHGTGLGLTLSASIVARHGGALRLDSLAPRTRFVLQLPRADAAGRKAAARAPRAFK